MQPRTIIHVINSLGRGGAEVLLANTIKLLPEYDHVVVTLSGPHDLLPEIESLLKAHYCLNALSKRNWASGVWQLRSIIKGHKPILVHAHLQVAGLLAKWGCPGQVPFFYSLHNPYTIDAFDANRLALPLERLTARTRHHLIGVSNLVLADYLGKVSGAGSSDTVYNMVEKSFFNLPAPKSYKLGEQLCMVSVGSLKRQKNYLFTLASMAILKDLPITLDIYGAGNEEATLKKFAQAQRLTNVRFMGKSASIESVLSNYHLYLISSSYEGFGIAPLEAMAAGLPVLASDIPVFREVAGDSVLYFDLSNPHSLANLLADVISGKQSLDGYGAAGKKRAFEIANPESYKSNLLNTYRKYVNI